MFPLLYKKSSRLNKTLTWQVVVEGNTYYTLSGELGGKIERSADTICEDNPAQKRTAEEQAIFEADAKHKAQAKKGYYADVRDEGKGMVGYNPMLATPMTQYTSVKRNVIKWGEYHYQEKINGVRCTVRGGNENEDGIPLMLSRHKGKHYMTVDHIAKQVKAFLPEGATLDGELYNAKLKTSLNELMSLVRKTVNITDEDIAKSRDIVEYHVFDYVEGAIEDSLPYVDRIAGAKKLVEDYYAANPDEPRYIVIHPTYDFNTKEEAEKFFNRIVDEEDGEGVIMRKKHARYINGRTPHMLKWKKESDAECIVRSISEGRGRMKGRAAIATVEWEDKTFDVTLVGTDADKEAIWNTAGKDLIGEVRTFKYMGLTGLGIPQYGRIEIGNSMVLEGRAEEVIKRKVLRPVRQPDGSIKMVDMYI